MAATPVTDNFDIGKEHPFAEPFRRRDPLRYFYIPVSCHAGRECTFGECPFAHTLLEKIFHPIVYKSQKCKDISDQTACRFQPRCTYIHGPEDKAEAELGWREWERKHYGWRLYLMENKDIFVGTDPDLWRRMSGIMRIRVSRESSSTIESASTECSESRLASSNRFGSFVSTASTMAPFVASPSAVASLVAPWKLNDKSYASFDVNWSPRFRVSAAPPSEGSFRSPFLQFATPTGMTFGSTESSGTPSLPLAPLSEGSFLSQNAWNEPPLPSMAGGTSMLFSDVGPNDKGVPFVRSFDSRREALDSRGTEVSPLLAASGPPSLQDAFGSSGPSFDSFWKRFTDTLNDPAQYDETALPVVDGVSPAPLDTTVSTTPSLESSGKAYGEEGAVIPRHPAPHSGFLPNEEVSLGLQDVDRHVRSERETSVSLRHYLANVSDGVLNRGHRERPEEGKTTDFASVFAPLNQAVSGVAVERCVRCKQLELDKAVLEDQLKQSKAYVAKLEALNSHLREAVYGASARLQDLVDARLFKKVPLQPPVAYDSVEHPPFDRSDSLLVPNRFSGIKAASRNGVLTGFCESPTVLSKEAAVVMSSSSSEGLMDEGAHFYNKSPSMQEADRGTAVNGAAAVSLMNSALFDREAAAYENTLLAHSFGDNGHSGYLPKCLNGNL